MIVPRGGKSLIARVRQEARVPVIGHLEGLCHVYVDGAANLEMARSIVLNAKLRRTGVCGAAETLLVDAAAARTHLAPLVREEIWRCLDKLRASGQTILVIDKYVERLIAVADRHTILERGQVVWRGTSAELDADHGMWHRYLGI